MPRASIAREENSPVCVTERHAKGTQCCKDRLQFYYLDTLGVTVPIHRFIRNCMLIESGATVLCTRYNERVHKRRQTVNRCNFSPSLRLLHPLAAAAEASGWERTGNDCSI